MTYLPFHMGETKSVPFNRSGVSPIKRFEEEPISRIHFVISACLASGLALALPVGAQNVAPGAPVPHVIVVRFVERPGAMPFAFEPANFTAHRGDTLRFVQASATMHNVHFKKQPKGAKLGAAAISPYLTTKGQTYTIVVDSRFTEGTYELVCDPHEALGMRGSLTVLGKH
ncbi:MAG: plastocyanin/azurin family copper-binding protein [Gemmatimonadaceae bacterium]|nr:plastocyanin/azurin family copper-binding protein [Gemmatimonadaceae bacterium]